MPSADWGPHDSHKKVEKEVFFPHRDIRYRSTDLKCKHNCLAKYNESFWDTALTYRHKLNRLAQQQRWGAAEDIDKTSPES